MLKLINYNYKGLNASLEKKINKRLETNWVQPFSFSIEWWDSLKDFCSLSQWSDGIVLKISAASNWVQPFCLNKVMW